MEKVSREKFIRLGSALGVGAAAASLAACGGGAGSGRSSGSGGSGGKEKAGSSAGGEAKGGGGAAIAQASEVAPGSALTFKEGGQDAVLVHLENGDFVAYSAVCTHQACTVAYQKGQLACPCHGSVFDPANGAEVVTGPAQSPLPEIPIEVKGGQVLRA
ncbi:MAG TPA: Rieske (2Fe-2S) protein [Rubrobacter sp.]|nr:Rieske (2Fe-2S) protein [Rubrobacter sp.]